MSATMEPSTGDVAAFRARFEGYQTSDSRASNASVALGCGRVASLKEKFEGRRSNATRSSDPVASNDLPKKRVFNWSDMVEFENAMRTCRNVRSMREALQRARDAGLPQYKISQCELRLNKADKDMQELQTAITISTIDSLEHALKNTEHFFELEPEFGNARELLNQLLTERTSHTRSTLLDCMAKISEDMRLTEANNGEEAYFDDAIVKQLHATIELGREHGIDNALLSSAQQLIPKYQAKLKLQAAMKKSLNEPDIEDLAQSIQEAVGFLNEDHILTDAKNLLTPLLAERLTRTQNMVRECMTQISINSNNGCLSRKDAQDLRTLIRLGEQHGIEGAMVSSANDALSQILTSEIFKCAICLQPDCDVQPLACCGRLETSNVLCEVCVSGLCARRGKCPFCRSQLKR